MIDHAPPDTRQSRTTRTTALPRLLTGLALLGMAMTGTALIAPGLALRTGSADHPDYVVIAGTGVVMIVLSSLFLAFASRVIGLGAAWLGLALLTNGLILFGKLVLAPFAFYRTTFTQGDPFMNVQSAAYFPILAAGVFVAEALVLGLLYAWARGRVTRALGPEWSALRRTDLVAALLTVGVALGAVVLLLSSLSLTGYGTMVVAATGGAAILAALLAGAAGGGAFREAARTSISVRDTAIVTSVFWLALSMLLVYHVVWVVFMTVLVSLWPLKVVAPSGK
jgi:hypothetical protein